MSCETSSNTGGCSLDLVTLDFETYYDDKYSLSKMTTEEYINDDRFEAIGVAAKVNDGETVWCTGNFTELEKFLIPFNLPNCAVLAHNCMFDAAILNWIYGIKPKLLLDTLSMSRALRGIQARHSLSALAQEFEVGEKGTEVIKAKGVTREDFLRDRASLSEYGGYCKNDVELTKKIFDILGEGFPRKELELIDITLRMFTEPALKLNTLLLDDHLDKTIQHKEKLLADSKYEKEVLMSNLQFAEVLKELGVEPPTKISPRTGKETFAFAKADKDFQALQEHEDLRVQTVVTARLGVKSTLEETRTKRFIGIAERVGILPIPLRYCAAHTTRWGGSDKINLQNLPSRGVNANTLKKAIVAPSGYSVINTDSSQIEARTLAWLSKQNNLVKAFKEKEDVYKIMASKIYRKQIGKITKGERFIGKAVILGCGYGMGAKKFKLFMEVQGIKLTDDEAEAIIETYRDFNEKIVDFWGGVNSALYRMISNDTKTYVVGNGLIESKGSGFVLPSGLVIQYPDLKVKTEGEGREKKNSMVYTSRMGDTYIYGAKSVENITQGVARCIIGEQIIQIAKKYRVVLTVHDSVICLVRNDEVSPALDYIESCMRCTPKWAEGLPLDCESGVGRSYGECE